MTKPYLATDFYKVSHAMNRLNKPALHPESIEYIYEVLTPRQNSFFPYDDKMEMMLPFFLVSDTCLVLRGQMQFQP